MDEYVTNFVQDLINIIESRIETLKLDRKRTLPVKKRQRSGNKIITWNIFPTTEAPQALLNHFLNDIESNLKGIEGEVIHFCIKSGDITDTGHKEFLILSGHTWEIYFYSSEIFIYLRLLLETKKAHPDEIWLSIDVDIVPESPWFVD